MARGSLQQWLRQFRADFKKAVRRNPSQGEWIDLDKRAEKYARQGQCPGMAAAALANPPAAWHQRKLHQYQRELAGASPEGLGFATGRMSAEREARGYYEGGGVERNPLMMVVENPRKYEFAMLKRGREEPYAERAMGERVRLAGETLYLAGSREDGYTLTDPVSGFAMVQGDSRAEVRAKLAQLAARFGGEVGLLAALRERREQVFRGERNPSPAWHEGKMREHGRLYSQRMGQGAYELAEYERGHRDAHTESYREGMRYGSRNPGPTEQRNARQLAAGAVGLGLLKGIAGAAGAKVFSAMANPRLHRYVGLAKYSFQANDNWKDMGEVQAESGFDAAKKIFGPQVSVHGVVRKRVGWYDPKSGKRLTKWRTIYPGYDPRTDMDIRVVSRQA